jgi:hypothetical protein
MNKRLPLLTLFCFIILITHAQIKWPAITQTSKPWTRWWWIGNAVNQKDLTANMELYKTAGLGGLEITPIYGVAGQEDKFIDFLSPKWMQMLDHTLAEGKRLGLGVDMATGTGWPFGGGPAIGADEACKDFSHKKWTLKAGETLQEPIAMMQEPFVRAVGNQIYELLGIWENKGPVQGTISAPLLKEASKAPDINTLVEPIYNNKNLQALALDQVKFRKPMLLQTLMAYSDKGQTIELTSKVSTDGKLNWTTPTDGGNWTLIGIFMGWHGKMVERAAPGGEGNVIDHFSKPILNKYLGQFDKAFKGHDLANLRGFFNDSYEVDDARGQSNYTPTLFDEFKKRRGYDLKQFLPSLLATNPTEVDLRVLYDYRQTISDLLLDQFTQPWKDWASGKRKLVRNQSHGSPANILDLYAAVDIPETEGTELLRFKFASSAGNVMGKKLVSAEASTWLNEHFISKLSDVKANIDNYFLGGVNHIVYHGTAYSPVNDPWPGWLFYASVHFQPTNPFWKDFGTLNNYVARCQSFLQYTRADNDILLYLPYADKNCEPAGNRGLLHHFDGMNGFERTTFYKVAEDLVKKGYSYDLISDSQIEKSWVLNKGIATNQFDAALGNKYSTIILPEIKYIPFETLEKLIKLANGGATIIFYKNTTIKYPGIINQQKEMQLKRMESLSFTDAGAGVRKAAVGSGSFLTGDDLESLLSYAKATREKMVDKGLQFIRKKLSKNLYYFIVNKNPQPVVEWVPLETKAAAVIYFDPMMMKSGLAQIRKSVDGNTEVLLHLIQGESCILQASTTRLTGKKLDYIQTDGSPISIEGKWKLTFTNGGPVLPSERTISKLQSWTELEGEDSKAFSGTAKYTIQFQIPPDTASTWLLDLGKVDESAVVSLNGKKLATLLGPTYQIAIPATSLMGQNELQIEVTNSMANRIIQMDKQGAEWKKFYNVNMPARLAENRDRNGLFTAAKWQPLSSGLIGPVTLTPMVIEY